MATIEFPPYGYMNAGLQWEMDTRRMPDTFVVGGRTATPAEFAAFLNALVDEMAAFLWPRYDPHTRSWVGKATAQMLPLTLADLALMQANPLQSLLLTDATIKGGRPLGRTHKAMFVREDDSRLDDLEAYVASTTPEFLKQLIGAFGGTLVKFGPSPLRFKEAFQRPRPYQVALMLNLPFQYEWAKSGVTPSLMSGHCIQGIVGSCGAYLALRRELETTSGGLAGLRQYGVDFGDRRVFAGVHYPSDNIASWFIALRLCDHLFGSAGQVAKDFMVQAIRGHSHVFEALMRCIAADPGSAFVESMKQLDQEMSRPAKNNWD